VITPRDYIIQLLEANYFCFATHREVGRVRIFALDTATNTVTATYPAGNDRASLSDARALSVDDLSNVGPPYPDAMRPARRKEYEREQREQRERWAETGDPRGKIADFVDDSRTDADRYKSAGAPNDMPYVEYDEVTPAAKSEAKAFLDALRKEWWR
jgi:hypothetical protein